MNFSCNPNEHTLEAYITDKEMNVLLICTKCKIEQRVFTNQESIKNIDFNKK